jgi:hypothetical protein
MRGFEEKVIDGHRYRVTPLPAGAGFAMLVLITQSAVPSLEAVPSLAELEDSLGGILARLARELDEAKLMRLVTTLREHTQFEKDRGAGNLVPLADHFELHFQGNYFPMLEWLAFALKVNFGPLLDALKQRVAARAAAAAAAAAAPTPTAAAER